MPFDLKVFLMQSTKPLNSRVPAIKNNFQIRFKVNLLVGNLSVFYLPKKNVFLI